MPEVVTFSPSFGYGSSLGNDGFEVGIWAFGRTFRLGRHGFRGRLIARQCCHGPNGWQMVATDAFQSAVIYSRIRAGPTWRHLRFCGRFESLYTLGSARSGLAGSLCSRRINWDSPRTTCARRALPSTGELRRMDTMSARHTIDPMDSSA